MGEMTADRFRFVILILATGCLTLIFSNMISVNFTLICMDDNRLGNGTVHMYTQTEKTMIQWSVSIAAMIATFPFSFICNKKGAKMVFFCSGIISAVATALIPLSMEIGFGWLLAVRVLQGIAYACDFTVIGVATTRWSSLEECAKFIALMTCFSPLANAFTNALSGWICDSSLGWPWVHYVHSIVTFILFALWFLLYTDDPQKNRFVSARELATIHKGKSESHKERSGFVPYLAICKNKVVWVVWLNAFADLYSGFFLFIYAPTYTKKVLGMTATETGIVGAIGSLSHIPVKLVCGYVSDSFRCIPERQKMWVFNSVAVLTPAAIYIYLCFAPADMPMVVVTLFAGVHAALGFNCGGFYKCGALVSRQYAEFVIAFTQFIKCGVFFVAPALVAIFVRDDSDAAQWHGIFYLTAAFLIIVSIYLTVFKLKANIAFCVFATDEPQSFTSIEKHSKHNVEHIPIDRKE